MEWLQHPPELQPPQQQSNLQQTVNNSHRKGAYEIARVGLQWILDLVEPHQPPQQQQQPQPAPVEPPQHQAIRRLKKWQKEMLILNFNKCHYPTSDIVLLLAQRTKLPKQ
ncbi:hypothetical protein C0Q70_10756 [Pomacea canaliculata]|uniref:Uncharacterized protein n=1 Tax=Pomacea canaliculata TaxID=400727 RepID=A0A2T7P438_POMCA|nr:hypothetical protein C0Q70_10756 [Pomacea canaliculata]